MTLHNAKGLEYDTVFIIGCEDGVFPHMRALEEGGEEEERRLCYVGITRARQRLYMTWARERRLFGRAERNLPSRFIDELPAELTERHASAAGAGGMTWGTPAPAPTPAQPIDPGPALELQTGDDVVHASFGDGVVTGGRAGRGGRRALRRRRHRAQADGRLRADPEALDDGGADHRRQGGRRRGARAGRAARSPPTRPRRGRAPALATVLVGDDPASEVYVAQQARGLRGGRDALRPPRACRPTTTRRSCWSWSASSNADDDVDGILVQLPLPDQIDPDAVVAAIDPAKDVDGLTPVNAGLLAHGHAGPGPLHAGRRDGAAAPRGGRARGRRGGRRRPLEPGRQPVARLLLARQRDRDRLPLAHPRPRRGLPPRRRAGRRGRRRRGCSAPTWSSPGAVVIDVGINRTDDGLVGDVDFEAAARGRRGDHAGARRRRPDDDRDAARQHAAPRRELGCSVAPTPSSTGGYDGRI